MAHLRIRILEDGDLDSLAVFLSEGFPQQTPTSWGALFSSFWDENPVWRTHIPRGWILEDESLNILGFIGNIPIPYMIFGSQGIAAASAAWYVKPRWRGLYSLRLLKEFLSQNGIGLFISNTPSQHVINILKKVGFASYPLPYRQTEYWLVINRLKCLDFILSNFFKSIPRPVLPFLRIVLYPLKYVLLPFMSMLGNSVRSSPEDLDFHLCRKCDESFTRLWEDSRTTGATTLHRNAETLNWLYFSKAAQGKKYVFACKHKKNGNLAGYFVYDIRVVSELNIRVAELRDIFLENVDEKVLLEFMMFSMQWARQQNIDLVKIWPKDAQMGSFLAKRIKIRKPARFPYYYKYSASLQGDPGSSKSSGLRPSPIEPDRGFS